MGNKLTRLHARWRASPPSRAPPPCCGSRRIHGIPVSTTQTITGGISGVGTARRFNAVRWNVATRVVWAWIFTIPGAALVSAVVYLIVELFS